MKESKTDPFINYKTTRVSGGDVAGKPVFCKDGKAIALSNKTVCHLYSTSTGEPLGKLFHCDSNIVALQADPDNQEEAIYAVTDAAKVYKFEIDSDNNPKVICSFESDEGEKKSRKIIHAVINRKRIFATWRYKSDVRLSVFNLISGMRDENFAYLEEEVLGRKSHFAIGSDFLLLNNGNFLKVFSLSSKMSRSHESRGVTCIAVHPEEKSFATGDKSGKIELWRNIFEKQPLKESYLWHTLPVRSLIFTASGTHLFSGGEEFVLVKWSLSNRMKTFLPRLGGVIVDVSISPDNTLLAVSTSEGKILIVNPAFACISTIQHFSKWSANAGTILAQNPRTNDLVLSGRPGHLQFLSGTDPGRFLFTFDVTQRNYITGSHYDIVEVKHAKFSHCGKWLITTEVGPNEAQLKFWAFDENKQEFSLNTCIDCPHGGYDITGLEIGAGDLAVTIGPDNKFRLWGLVESVYLQQTRLIWAELNSRTHRNMPCGAVDMTRDGSLIAVGFGPSVTLWDTAECVLKASLTPPLQREAIQIVRFGNDRVAHLVVSSSKNELVCWNMVTLLRQWVVPLCVDLLISDSSSCFMCAFATSGSIFIFDPSSPNPEFRNKKQTKAKAAIFVANATSPQVYFLTTRQELHLLSGDTVQGEREEEETKLLTPFAIQKAQRETRDVLKKDGAVVHPQRFTADVLQGPAHGLPHVSLLCEDLLRGLLLTAPPLDTTPNTEEDVILVEPTNTFQVDMKTDESELKRVVKEIFSKGFKNEFGSKILFKE